jgi:hypothetical protein
MVRYRRRKSTLSRLQPVLLINPSSLPLPEQFWETIKPSDAAGLFEEFLKRYPRSSHASEAWERARSLSAQSTTTKTANADPNQEASGAKQKSPSPEDVARFDRLASELQMKLPSFSMATIEDDVPKALRRFMRYGTRGFESLARLSIPRSGVIERRRCACLKVRITESEQMPSEALLRTGLVARTLKLDLPLTV